MINWDSLAQKAGLPGGKELLEQAYRDEGLSISRMAAKFGCGTNSIRAALHKYKIDIRNRGGANFQKVIVDDALLKEIRQDGVIATAIGREVDPSALYKALRRAGLNNKGEPVQRPTSELPVEGDPQEQS